MAQQRAGQYQNNLNQFKYSTNPPNQIKYIEFEFESYNYILHKHYEAYEICDLIICWKHDEQTQTKWERWKEVCWKESKLKQSKPLPLILPIRNLLQDGTINLINLNKP
jgi:hypothetical protein